MRAAVTTLVWLALSVPVALAGEGHDQGQGIYGEADDKVVTNAGFLVIAFFPLFILAMSLLQWRLDKRKDRRKKAKKALSGEWRGGW